MASRTVAPFLTLFMLGCGDPDSDRAAALRKEIPDAFVSSDDLYSAYKTNEVAADARYKDKIAVVRGPVKVVGKGSFGGHHVTFAAPHNRQLDAVQAHFPESAADKLAALTPGQTIGIRGRVVGLSVGMVQLTDCSLED